MPGEVLSRRALNRALLERQVLLRRSPLPGSAADRAGRVVRAVEHLLGLQAQAPFPPYYGLWSRLEEFRPGELAALITGRQVVRIALMRGTIHLVSARDCLTLRPLVQPVLDRALAATYGRQLTGLDPGELAAAGRALTEAEPRTFSAYSSGADCFAMNSFISLTPRMTLTCCTRSRMARLMVRLRPRRVDG